MFGVAPVILNEQLYYQLEKFIRFTSPARLMAESDASMLGERRAINHPWESFIRFGGCLDRGGA